MFNVTVLFNDFQSLLCPVKFSLYGSCLFTILVDGGAARPNLFGKLAGLVGQFNCTEVHKLIHQLLFFSVKANYCNFLHFNY